MHAQCNDEHDSHIQFDAKHNIQTLLSSLNSRDKGNHNQCHFDLIILRIYRFGVAEVNTETQSTNILQNLNTPFSRHGLLVRRSYIHTVSFVYHSLSYIVIMALQHLWKQWMTGEQPCTTGIICDWEEEHFAADAERWQQGLSRLSIPERTTTGLSHNVPRTRNDSDSADSDDDSGEVKIHVKQTETWDCGIACLLMALKWLHKSQIRNSDNTTRNAHELNRERKSWMLQTAGTESIWSIDLVFIMEEYKMKMQKASSEHRIDFTYLFSSKTLEVDEEYKDLRFYEKAFGTDQARVSRLFDRAQQEDWNLVVQHHLRLDQLMELICRPDCIAIALVDNNTILMHERNSSDKKQKKKSTHYAGHYIVLSGLTANGDLQIHNPAKSKIMQCMPLSLFEKAWRAKGTDNDILFLVKQ